MPRVSTDQVVDVITERLMKRRNDMSEEWLRAWVRRWGRKVAEDTEHEPLFLHETVEIGKSDGTMEEVALVGPDRVPINLYREWKDVQDGTRKIRGTADGAVFWID